MKKLIVIEVNVCRGERDDNVKIIEGRSLVEYLEGMDKEEMDYYLNWSDGGGRVFDKEKLNNKKCVVLDGEENYIIVGDVDGKEELMKLLGLMEMPYCCNREKTERKWV